MDRHRVHGSVAERLAAAAARELIGRVNERCRLAALLKPGGPAAVFVHGPGGIGKTTLVTGTLRSLELTTFALDGRRVEPTVPGALAAIGGVLGVPAPSSVAAAVELIAAASTDVLLIDSFERLNLLDGWIRNELARALPASVTVLLVGRRGPNDAWRTAPGWRTLLAELAVGPMSDADVGLLLAAHGVGEEPAERIRAFARGYPLAAVLAAEALARRPELPLGSGAPADVIEELFTVMLDDLPSDERATVEAAAVLRRVTLPLLAAVVDDGDVERAWQTLRRLPFTTTTASGLEISGVAAPVLLEALELRDPRRVAALRVRAARTILDSLSAGPDWQSTADLLHLVQNPLIRHAYAPPGRLQHPAERARTEDRAEIVAITERFAGQDSARLAQSWWEAHRQAFSVVRGPAGQVAGFSVTAALDFPVNRAHSLSEDPAIRATAGHLRRYPMPASAQAVLFRWALGSRYGERFSPEVATLVIDLKRTYLELRAVLRRVYTVVADWPAAAPVLQVMGFDALEELRVGTRQFTLACLDFGAGGVDAWIGRHVLAEQAAVSAAAARRPAGTSGSAAAQPTGVIADRPSVLMLTAREQEVLALLAEGMTNAQLAQTLFISERTANRHVSNIFLKLGVHNRTQAARAAVDAGLSG
jgi:DNA-binding CsgD family transcriptional regulator